MPRLKLRAGSTFWFEYQGEARHVFLGQEFEIDAKDFPLYEKVARDLVEGTLPSNQPAPTFRDRIVTKAKKVAAAVTGSSFVCSDCGQKFRAQAGLDIHVKNAHKKAVAK